MVANDRCIAKKILVDALAEAVATVTQLDVRPAGIQDQWMMLRAHRRFFLERQRQQVRRDARRVARYDERAQPVHPLSEIEVRPSHLEPGSNCDHDETTQPSGFLTVLVIDGFGNRLIVRVLEVFFLRQLIIRVL